MNYLPWIIGGAAVGLAARRGRRVPVGGFVPHEEVLYTYPGRPPRKAIFLRMAGPNSVFISVDGKKLPRSQPVQWIRRSTRASGKEAAGVSEHRWFQGGKEGKTVCTSAVLAAFGIDACQYHYSGYLEQRLNVLRKFGWSARSRNSKLRKGESVGAARKLIAQHKWGDPPGTRYMISVPRHALLLDYDGNTIVDTDARTRDRRKVLDIRAVFRNPRRGRRAEIDWDAFGFGPQEPVVLSPEDTARYAFEKQAGGLTRLISVSGLLHHPIEGLHRSITAAYAVGSGSAAPYFIWTGASTATEAKVIGKRFRAALVGGKSGRGLHSSQPHLYPRPLWLGYGDGKLVRL
jgi:hypothetical protein